MLDNPENINGTVQTQQIDPSLHHRRGWEISLRRVLGAAAVLGVAGSLVVDTHPLSPGTSTPSSGSNIAEARVSRTHDPAKLHATRAHRKADQTKHCTSLRSDVKYLYLGYLCVEDGDSYMKIGSERDEKGWVYSVARVAMKGKDIYKCGFVREGVLPLKPSRSRAVSHCKDYYSTLVENRYTYFQKKNCGELPSGLDACRDGTYFSPITSTCKNPNTYRNYESDEPSPVNVFGTGQGGFRDRIKINNKNSVHYRVEFKTPTSGGTKGIVVRAPIWGWGHSTCVADKHRSGGTPTITARE